MRLLGVSGSLRHGSRNKALLRATGETLLDDIDFVVFDGLKAVPPYDADDDTDPAPAAVARLRDAIAGADRAGRILGRPLDPRRALVVGDTPRDVDAAHAAGAIAVGVASGHFSASQLAEAGADHVLESLREELPGVAEHVR